MMGMKPPDYDKVLSYVDQPEVFFALKEGRRFSSLIDKLSVLPLIHSAVETPYVYKEARPVFYRVPYEFIT